MALHSANRGFQLRDEKEKLTLICSHRVNDPSALASTPKRFGVEIDLRSDGGSLILEHDAFVAGPRFEDWLDSYDHRFIVLNTKEEGLESEIIRILADREISDWSFLDQSFPSMVRTLREGETRTMARISEYESIETIERLPVKPRWIWVDSFTGVLPDSRTLRTLSDSGFLLMAVSSELQGRDFERGKAEIVEAFTGAGVSLAGVCTKRPEAWEQEASRWWA